MIPILVFKSLIFNISSFEDFTVHGINERLIWFSIYYIHAGGFVFGLHGMI